MASIVRKLGKSGAGIIYNRMLNSCEEKIQSNEDVLNRLNLLNGQMENLQSIPQQLLRAYVDTYVRRHSLSEDFFSALCEHCIMMKLFGAAARNIPAVAVLQIFNLLLANTSQQNSLVFIFSQAALHEYLFEKFNHSLEAVQTVEYYVQLLKTIVLKVNSHGNNSLIKLFCNNRYPSFPLLSTVLALVAYPKEQLVRVTASQCVLQLISLINEKRVGRGFLADVQMVLFYYEIASALRQDTDEEGALKYLADLLYALRDNPISLSLLLSALTNVVLLPLLSDLPALLRLLRRFDQLMREHGKFPGQKYRLVRRVLLNIFSTFYFAKFTNSTYMAALKLLTFPKLPQPDLRKYLQKRGEKVGAFLLEFDTNNERTEEDQKQLVLQSWSNFNHSSEEVQKIKQGKLQKRNSLFGLFTKTDPLEDYIRNALMAVGLNYEELRFPIFKLSVSLNYKTAVFLIEEALTRKEERGELLNREKMEAHMCDFKGKFELDEQLCIEVLYMLKRLQSHSVFMTQENNKYPPEVEFEYRFLLKLRSHLLGTLGDHLLVTDKELSLRALAVIRLSLERLGVLQLLDLRIRKKLVWKLEEVQQQLNDLNFAKDFREIIGYIINNKEEEFLEVFDTSGNLLTHNFNAIELKAFKYEFLRTIVDPQLQSLTSFVNQKWSQAISKSNLSNLKLVYPYRENGRVEIRPSNFGILLVVKSSEYDRETFIKIREQDPRTFPKDQYSLEFKQLPYLLTMRESEHCSEVINSIKSIRSLREERIIKVIVQYFEITYNSIRDRIIKQYK